MQLTSLLLLSLLLTLAAAAEPGERQKRGTLTLDFGLLLRNVLQKSAQLSSAKANITRSVAAAKRPAATTTTTTTAAPAPARPRRPRPQYGPGWWPPHAYGYYPYDYDADYGYAPPPPPAPPQPLPQAVPRRVRPPPRSLSNYYDYDYDVDAAAPPPPPPPRPGPRPRARQQPQPPAQAEQAAPPPPPPRPRPRPRPAAGNQLSDQLIYQYAQPDDIYSKPDNYAAAPATAAAAAEDVDENVDEKLNENVDVASFADNPSPINIDNELNEANNPIATDDKEQSKEIQSNRFLVNYPSEDSDSAEADLYAPGPAAKFNAYDVYNTGASSPEYKYYNSYASPAPGTQQSNYFTK